MLIVALPTAIGGYFYGYNRGKNKQRESYSQEIEE